jgi:hypothetical protein
MAGASWMAVIVLTTLVIVISTAAYALRVCAAARRKSWYEECEFFCPLSFVLYLLGLLSMTLSLELC